MLSSRLTSKGQATIPAEVREQLGLRPGDRVIFEVEGDAVRIRRAAPADAGPMALSSAAFSDWNAPEADEAFRDL